MYIRSRRKRSGARFIVHMGDISNAYVGGTTIILKWIFKQILRESVALITRIFCYVDLIIQ